jgi:wyosine [tRNA(Phe)-imidazoG37] synthetase (radical SAM superfamily)
MTTDKNQFESTVYGPVLSWRVGQSLGIDLILETSVCSFNCIYCQLGSIQVISNQRKVFVQTSKVIDDFKASLWQKSDIITYSGSGEPTLARNLGEIASHIARITDIPQLVLTNGTLLNDPEVIADLQKVDRVFVKIDAASEDKFQRINRPVSGVTLESIVKSAQNFKRQFNGVLGVQVMFLPLNKGDVDQLAKLLIDIKPDEVQLNTPTRPYPKSWHIAARGGHNKDLRPYESTPLRAISIEDAQEIEDRLKELTGLNIVSVYQQ